MDVNGSRALLPAEASPTARPQRLWPSGGLGHVNAMFGLLEPDCDDIEKVVVAWAALGPNAAEIARVCGVTVAFVQQAMGAGVVAGVVRDDGTVLVSDLVYGLDRTLVAVSAVSLVLEGRCEARRISTVDDAPHGGAVLADELTVRLVDAGRGATEVEVEQQPAPLTWEQAIERMESRKRQERLTWEQVAHQIGATPAYVYAWRRSPSTVPTAATATRLAAWLDVTIDLHRRVRA